MTTDLCPYCRKFYFKMLDHVFDCSKDYIDLKLRRDDNYPLRRTGKDRRGVIVNRRQNKDLILYHSNGEISRLYLDEFDIMRTNRRYLPCGRRSSPRRSRDA